MNGELSHGLAILAASGNRIINSATGAVITLRGVNRSGLEYAGPDEQGFLSGAGISRLEIRFIVKEWNCNVVRLPFNQDFVLRGCAGRSGEEYQRALDQVISWNSFFGAYTLLDLQWLDAERVYGGGKDKNYVAPLPNAASIDLWKMLASRYRDEPAVLYDLFNEPHDRLPDDPYPLNRFGNGTYPADQRAVTMQEWQPWARALAQAVRNGNPNALVFIAGTNWAYDLRGMPMDIVNAVYSTHIYFDKGDDWSGAFGDLALRVPVFVGELGGQDTKRELEFGRRLLQFLEDRKIGWAAWSWSNEPFLVSRYAPTEFGNLVRRRLSTSVEFIE
jgi:endoglucanase